MTTDDERIAYLAGDGPGALDDTRAERAGRAQGDPVGACRVGRAGGRARRRGGRRHRRRGRCGAAGPGAGGRGIVPAIALAAPSACDRRRRGRRRHRGGHRRDRLGRAHPVGAPGRRPRADRSRARRASVRPRSPEPTPDGASSSTRPACLDSTRAASTRHGSRAATVPSSPWARSTRARVWCCGQACHRWTTRGSRSPRRPPTATPSRPDGRSSSAPSPTAEAAPVHG